MNEELRMKAVEALQELLDVNRDSLELGTPAKGGAMKIYGNFMKPEDFKQRIDQALEARAYAQKKMEVPG